MLPRSAPAVCLCARMKTRLPPVLLLLGLVFTTPGCVTHLLTKAIVEAPNRRSLPYVLSPQGKQQLRRDDRTYAKAWMLPVGPPPAKLSVAVVAPGNYRMTHTIKTGTFRNGRAPVWPQTDWTLPPTDPPAAPKATIVVLHGYQDAKEDMMHWALYLAQAGYRVVLVDLRGHGRSTGKWIGYGAFETHDLEQVLDDLQKRGLTHGPVGVLGLSYGASVGLQLAGHDRRVGAVAALEPFANPRRAVVHFARAVVPRLVENWTARDFARTEDRAGRMAGFSWQKADVLKSVAQTKAPVLYIHAAHDRWVSTGDCQTLAAHTRSLHAVMTMTFTNERGLEDHVLLSWILNPIAPWVVKWFDECLLRPGPDLRERLVKAGFGLEAAPGPDKSAGGGSTG